MAITDSPSNRPFPWQGESHDSSFTVEFPKAPDMTMVLIGAELYRNPEEHDRLVLHFKGHPSNKKAGLITGQLLSHPIINPAIPIATGMK